MNINLIVAIGACAAYVAGVVLLLPANAFVHMLGVFAALMVLVFTVNARKARLYQSPGSIMAISVLGTFLLAVPHLPAMGGQHTYGLPLGFLGAQAAVLLWIAVRWSPGRSRHRRVGITSVVGIGLAVAAMLSAIATIPIVVGLLIDGSRAAALLLVYPAYFLGGIGAAGVYWLLQGISHQPVGRYLIGAIAGICLYGAVAPVVMLLRGSEFDIARMVVIATICGVFVGPPVALSQELAA